MQSSIPTGLLITAFLADTFALLAVPDMSTLKTSNYFCAIRFRRNNSSLRDLKDSVPFTVSKNCNLLQLHSLIIILIVLGRCTMQIPIRGRLLIICLYVTPNIQILLCILISHHCDVGRNTKKLLPEFDLPLKTLVSPDLIVSFLLPFSGVICTMYHTQ